MFVNTTMNTHFIPIFPLNLIVFPTEKLNLHIFEPRYKQLITEIAETKGAFGITLFDKGKVAKYGTEMHLLDIAQIYPNGEMDIRTQGRRVFELLYFQAQAPHRLYPWGEVTYKENVLDADDHTAIELTQALKKLHELLNVRKEFPNFDSFTIAHYVGLGKDELLYLLTLDRESERQQFLLYHLNNWLPTLEQEQFIKEKVQMNGHFRDLPELKF